MRYIMSYICLFTADFLWLLYAFLDNELVMSMAVMRVFKLVAEEGGRGCRICGKGEIFASMLRKNQNLMLYLRRFGHEG